MLKFRTREQCEQFQIMRFGVSCATCERSDEECPWNRDDAKQMTSAAELEEPITFIAA
jgi:MoaA/NifB/PqqE/SkfB family radical SAM enzyme